MPRGFVGCPSDRWGRGGGTRTTSSDLESFAVGVVWIGGCFQGLWTFLRLVRGSWMGFGGMIGASHLFWPLSDLGQISLFLWFLENVPSSFTALTLCRRSKSLLGHFNKLEEHRDVDLRTDFVMYAEGKNAHIIKIMPNLFETQKQP